MPKEREWKFLVLRGPSLEGRRSKRIEQGYLGEREGLSVRVRITDRKEALLGVKVADGKRRSGPASRDEYEYEIPLADARRLLAATDLVVTKRRYDIGEIELDVFEGELAGLVLAEVEVDGKSRKVPRPPAGWKWKDVSQSARFTNLMLAKKGMPRKARRLKNG